MATIQRPVIARAAPPPPRLSYADGDVSFWRPGGDDWVPAQVNTPLAPGDQLYTGNRGNLEIQIEARSFVRAWGDSQLGVENHDPTGSETGILPTVGISIPLPLFSQGQGSIAVAEAERDREARLGDRVHRRGDDRDLEHDRPRRKGEVDLLGSESPEELEVGERHAVVASAVEQQRGLRDAGDRECLAERR